MMKIKKGLYTDMIDIFGSVKCGVLGQEKITSDKIAKKALKSR